MITRPGGTFAERITAEPDGKSETTWRIDTADGDADLLDVLAYTVENGLQVHTICALEETGFFKVMSYHVALV